MTAYSFAFVDPALHGNCDAISLSIHPNYFALFLKMNQQKTI